MRRWLQLAAFAVLFTLTCLVWSQPADPSAEDRATARNLMDVGDDKLKAGDLEGALKAYRGADAIMRVPTTAIEVGKVQAELGLLIEAADTLQGIARFPKRADEPAPFTKARDDARILMARVSERTPSIKVKLAGVPGGESATIAIDDKLLPDAAKTLPRKVNPGKHQVKAQAGDSGAIASVEVAEGEKRELTLELKAGVDAGLGTAATQPDADEAPQQASDPGPDAGGENSGGEAGISPLVWAGVAIGAAGIIVGAITGGLTLSKESSLQDSCPNKQCTPGEGEDELDSSLTLAHVSTVGFAVGGAGIALAIVGLIISDFGDSQEQATVTPWIGPGSAGLRGSF